MLFSLNSPIQSQEKDGQSEEVIPSEDGPEVSVAFESLPTSSLKNGTAGQTAYNLKGSRCENWQMRS